MKLLAIQSAWHAHILDEQACKATPREVERDLRLSMKYFPYLSVFRHVNWTVETHIIRKDSYALSKKVLMEKLRKQGYTVV